MDKLTVNRTIIDVEIQQKAVHQTNMPLLTTPGRLHEHEHPVGVFSFFYDDGSTLFSIHIREPDRDQRPGGVAGGQRVSYQVNKVVGDVGLVNHFGHVGTDQGGDVVCLTGSYLNNRFDDADPCHHIDIVHLQALANRGAGCVKVYPFPVFFFPPTSSACFF